ncbi:MAG: arginine--tRNA ligase [Planctomycetota bacterium]
MANSLSIAQRIEDLLKDSIQKTFGRKAAESLKLQAPPDPEMGDFAFGCFPLAKLLRKAPPVIAAELADGLGKSELLEKVEAAGPYLNFFVDKAFLARNTLENLFHDPEGYGRSVAGKGTSVLVEYSAPNTNKPQHLGHVRNNALGISISNLLQAAGHKVIPVNLVNDRGIHICKSMLAFHKFGEGKSPADAGRKGDHFVGDFYVRYDQEEGKEKEAWLAARGDKGEGEDLEEAFLKESKWYGEAKEMLRKWEAGDAETRALWEKMNGWVYEGFDATYERLGCRFEKVYYESGTYELGKALVRKGLDEGVFYQKEDGSVWVDLSKDKLDQKLVLRSDGTSVYITQDLGTTKLKFDDFKMDKAVWIVADEQIYHFQVLFAVLKRLGFTWADGCFHLAYGMVDLPEGKMKSRKGTVVDADDLMDELYCMEVDEIRSRDIPIGEEDVEPTAETLAQGALKFFILKFLPKTRMTFNPKESISPEGFTGPYVQYAYVRIQSIFRKAGIDSEKFEGREGVLEKLTRPEETAVIRRIIDFPEEVRISAESYNPSRLCNYLFELARDYNRFYHALPVIKAEDEDLMEARIALSQAAAVVLKQGLALLGIDVPDRM